MLHKKGQQSSLPIAPVQYTADKIVVLESGRIVESGSHDDLMSKTDEESGVYYKMVKLQQSTTNCEGLSSLFLPKEARSYTRRSYNMPVPSCFYVKLAK